MNYKVLAVSLILLPLPPGPSDTDFLDWLRGALTDALKASTQHESLKKVVRGLRAFVEVSLLGGSCVSNSRPA